MRFQRPHLASSCLQAFEQLWAVSECFRSGTDGYRGKAVQPAQLGNAGSQKLQAFAGCHAFIMEGGQQIQNDGWERLGFSLSQQVFHLVASEGARQLDAFKDGGQFSGLIAQGARDGGIAAINVEAIAAINQEQPPAQRQASYDFYHERATGAGCYH
jgi:hypothetical protein